MSADERLLFGGAMAFSILYFAGVIATAIALQNTWAALAALAGAGASCLAYGLQANRASLATAGLVVTLSWVFGVGAWAAILAGVLSR